MREQTGRLVVAVIAVVFVVAGVFGLARGVGFGLNHVVHLGFGLAGLAVVRSARGSRRYLIGGGVLYVLWHYGAVTVLSSGSAGALNTTNDWLNLWFAASMIALACVVGDRPEPAHRARELDRGEESDRWRRTRAAVSSPSARPRRPRPAAGNRPRLAGAFSGR
ncbi:DUF4383 domain-containing protein [Actinophytocola gossypii]|uniref:DUF4383 domain-containing protein n=1 Tax=Actinophytocola gossypii TaxID=2812003 RepID=A0ABT2J1A4_9PSEU|nr:DUF4383 domain-containing protein [Actinophytocola gossypii]MCT2581631.1 DUF4383 domain-containing protein [Actinophytocola gossypii]